MAGGAGLPFAAAPHSNRGSDCIWQSVDHGTNMTFVMYPKADSSRIVKRQGKEPYVSLWPASTGA